MNSKVTRLWAWCIVTCGFGVFAWAALPVLGGGSSQGSVAQANAAPAGVASGSNMSLASLVVPDVQPLDQSQQAVAAQQARHSSSAAYVARILSRTEFSHLGPARAAQVAREAFPEVIDHPAGGPPQLPADTRIAQYIAPTAAQLDLPGGEHGVIESMQPMAKEVSKGHFTPIDLGLTANNGGYVPATSDVPVQIPKHVGAGVTMPQNGVSLTPVDATGEPLQGSEGSVDGSAILYANTESEADTVVKPTSDGFEIDVMLRSPESPGKLYFHVGMPSGARLVQQTGSGAVQVVINGNEIAGVRVPTAQDASGMAVPVQMSVAGDTLVLTVDRSSDEYQYPIEVDPYAYTYDTTVSPPSGGSTNWHFASSGNPSFVYGYQPEEIFMQSVGSYLSGEHEELDYQAKGEADVFYISAYFSNKTENAVAGTALQFANESGVEAEEGLSGIAYYSRVQKSLCTPPPGAGCAEIPATHGNVLRVIQTAFRSSSEVIYAAIFNATVGVAQTQAPEVSVNTYSPILATENELLDLNVFWKSLFGGEKWIGSHNGSFQLITHDAGLGISDASVRGLAAGETYSVNLPVLGVGACAGVWCNPSYDPILTYNKAMGEGEDPLELCAEDAAHLKTCTASTTLKVDNTPPKSIKLTGLAETGAEISAAQHQITVEAIDGTQPTPSSGIKSIKVAVDGKEIGVPHGECAPGECTASGTWTIDAETLGAGVHELVIKATDNAENGLEKRITFAVRDATPVTLGPGTVDPVTGQFALTATDVSLAGVGGVSRTYQSRQLSTGAESPLGPQWSMSLGAGAESLTLQSNGSAVLSNASGGLTTFAYNATKKEFEAPEGDGNLKLEAKEKEAGKGVTEYLLKDVAQGTATKFERPSGGGSTIWLPTIAEGPATSSSDTYSYKAVTVEGKTVIQPSEELGPKPEGVSCSTEASKSEKGCRELTFKYATKTGAGEKESEWGEYNGRLMKVLFTAYNPSTKAMEVEKAVAEYAYDKLGRLRAEWDPRISPALKTVYGYDAEGHVTALTPPGEESWAFTYGASAGDLSTGRLLKVTRAPASAKLWNGELPKNTELPKLSGTVGVGATLGVSTGTWSNEPVAYAFQWEDCNLEGKECVPIPGGTNANYTVGVSDVGHALTARVSAINGGGSISASVSTSITTSEYALANGSDPTAITTGSDGNLWFTDLSSKKIGKITPAGKITEYEPKTAGGPYDIAAGSDKNLWFTDPNTSKIGRITPAGEIKEYELPKESSPYGIAPGPENDLWFTDGGSSKIGKITTSGVITEYALPKGSYPEGITEGPEADVWFTETGEFGSEKSKIGRITPSGEIKEYELPKGSRPDSITTGSDGNLWFTDFGAFGSSTSKVGKITPAGVVTEYTLPTPGYVHSITAGPEGKLWFTESPPGIGLEGKSKILTITTSGVISETSLRAKDEATGITTGPEKNIWFTNSETECGIGKITTSTSEGTRYSPQPGSTVEYNVPLSGTGLPEMTAAKVKEWGQKDDPAYAAAIFPPDEPMGWPASGYKRASFTYLDAQDRTVNTASPSGAIATVEYNKTSEVIRSLSPDDRAIALKEAKPAEAAELLDTKTEYNAEGTEIIKTLGPQHIVKLKSGAEVQARADKHYYYNESAPEGETYRLVTKTVTAALEAGKEEDKRTIITSFSGQANLGWKLRQPTSVTTDPGGLNLTTTTVYQEKENAKKEKESTGAVVETRSPEGSGSHLPQASVFAMQFGSHGSGNAQLSYPTGGAVDAHGDVWVGDFGNDRVEEYSAEGKFIAVYGSEGTAGGQFAGPGWLAVNQSSGNVYVSDLRNNRVEELSSAGKFVSTFGFGVSDGKEEAEVCTSSCRAGIAGTGAGQFKEPEGVAIDASGNVWIVDHGNNRIEEFSAEGKFIATYGTKGSGNVQFTEPVDVAVSNGDLYVTDSGNGRVEELSKSGAYVGRFGSGGSGNGQFSYPYGIASDPSSGALYVGDPGNGRVEEFSETGEYQSQFGTAGTGSGQLKEGEGLAVSAAGGVYAVDTGNSRVELWEPASSVPVFAGQFGNTGSESEKVENPYADAVDAHGNLWVANTDKNSVEEYASSGTFLHSFGSWGTGAGQYEEPASIEINKTTGNVYVGDESNNRVDELNEKGEFVETFGFGVSNGKTEFEVCTTSCKAGIAGGGTGQFNEPNGVTIDPSGDIWVADQANNRIEEFSSSAVFIETIGFGVSNGEEKFEICTTGCRAGIQGSGSGQFSNPADVISLNSGLYVADLSNSRIEKFSSKGEYVSKFGSYGTGNGQIEDASGLGADPYGNLYVADLNNNRIDEFTPSGTFLADFGTKGAGNGQLSEPSDLAISSTGAIYVADASNNRISQWAPAPRPGNEGAHDDKTIYYSAKGEAEVAACQNHPEWANLVCQTEPVAQSGATGAPALPTVTTTYNIWDAPEVVTEKFGSTTRTKKQIFDGAGRKTGSEVTSSVDTALPKVTSEYSTETGALVKQSTVVGEETKTISSAFNRLGQLESYTDADGNTSKYVYDVDGRVEEINDGKGFQIYSYDPTTGFLTKLLDSAAATFTATYDVEGKIVTSSYPNGMTAENTYNQLGSPTGIKYVKNAHCASTCPETWFSDAVVPSIYGEALKQTSSLSKESYAYDNAGRLLETQETPTGKGCTTRLYAYDEESNRTALVTRESGTETCASEGGSLESHSYDSANHLIDAGVGYETFGNTTKLPGVDAGGYELKSSYYVDNQVASQEQNGETVNYKYDPEGRTRETVSAGKTAATVISHYASPGEVPAWTSEGTEKWTRHIPGIDGALDAIQSSGGSTVLQVHDLQGDIVATAALGEAETKLLGTYNSTEFGVPREGKQPPKYAWLGAGGAFSELTSGAVTEGGASYVPEIARSLQTETVIPPGAYPNGSGPGAPYTTELSPWVLRSGEEAAANMLKNWEEAQKQKAEEEEALAALHNKELEESMASPSESGGEGPEVIGQRPQPITPEDPIAHESRHHKKSPPPQCQVGRPVHITGDPSAGCCPNDSAFSIQGAAGHFCDVPSPGRGQPYESPGVIDCGEGTFPAIGPNGKPTCMVEGEREQEEG